MGCLKEEREVGCLEYSASRAFLSGAPCPAHSHVVGSCSQGRRCA